MASFCRFGGFSFEENEVNLVNVNKQTTFSQRGRRLQRTETAQCFGEIQGDSAGEIIGRIPVIEQALRNVGVDFTYGVSGGTPHVIRHSGDCVSAVRCVNYSFPKGDGAELVTRRSFSFTVQAVYDACDEDLIYWQETVQTIGTGGPRWYVLETIDDIPRAIFTAQKTAVTYKQTGMAIGYTAYPDEPGPLNPAGEMEAARSIIRSNAQQLGNGLRFYPIRWSYTMYRDPSTFGQLDIFPTSKE